MQLIKTSHWLGALALGCTLSFAVAPASWATTPPKPAKKLSKAEAEKKDAEKKEAEKEAERKANEQKKPEASAAAHAGRVAFNDHCSHCHGADGFSPVLERDLRRLKLRYKDEWHNTAITTIAVGRPDNGMPSWGQSLSGETLMNIVEFLKSIQK